jgi:hypothetical protein
LGHIDELPKKLEKGGVYELMTETAHVSKFLEWWDLTFNGYYAKYNRMAFIMEFSMLLILYIAFYWVIIIWAIFGLYYYTDPFRQFENYEAQESPVEPHP